MEAPAVPNLTAPRPTPPGRRDLATLPKAHLHLHFTGAMRPTTMVEMAHAGRAPAPSPAAHRRGAHAGRRARMVPFPARLRFRAGFYERAVKKRAVALPKVCPALLQLTHGHLDAENTT